MPMFHTQTRIAIGFIRGDFYKRADADSETYFLSRGL